MLFPNSYKRSEGSCKLFGMILLTGMILAYSVAIGIYECNMGGIAATTVINYYDYSVPINGTNVRIAIDALPRDVYKNTKEMAIIMLISGIIGSIFALSSVVYGFCTKNKTYALIGSVATMAVVVTLPFCYSAFMSAKLSTMSSDDIALWNSINPEFINGYIRAQALLIATVVPGVVFSVLLCVTYIMSAN
jgi:hypothetical protein